MIVIASEDPGVISEISTLLKQRGDLFTVATDEIQALAEVRTDRASLIIIDTGSSVFDGFSLSRAIKNDTALQGFPVLCLVDLSGITPLLSALDCMADAFLPRPFDLASVSAAIGDLQARQAEGAAPAVVRTRFRITHDGKEYYVVADRRQLLDHLLMAFESAIRVNKEKEEMRADLLAEVRNVGERLTALTAERDATVTNLHEELEERSRTISRLNASIQAKEQAEALSKTRMENISQELKELGVVLEATRRSDEEKSRTVTSLQSDFADLEKEKKRVEQELSTKIGSLEAQVRDTVSDLDSARSTIAGLRVNNAELERTLSSVRAECDECRETIKSLEEKLNAAVVNGDGLQGRCRQLETLLEEKEAASAAREREVKTALDNMTRDVNSIQSALEQNIRQLEGELSLRKQLEQQVESLTKERDMLTSAGDNLQEQNRQLKSTLEGAKTASAAREQESKAALENVTCDMRAIQDALEQNIRQLNKELSMRQDLEKQTTILARERDELVRTRDENAARFSELRAQVDANREAQIRIQTECDAIRAEHDRTQDVLGTTFRELERTMEDNKSLREAQENCKKTAADIAELREQVDLTTADLASVRSTLKEERRLRMNAETERTAFSDRYADAKKSLDSAFRDIGVLNTTLDQEREKNAALENRLSTSERENNDKDRAIKALKEELAALRSTETAELAALSGADEQGAPKPDPADKPAEGHQAGNTDMHKPSSPAPSVQVDMLSGTVSAAVKPEGDPPLLPPPSHQNVLPSTEPPAFLPGAKEPQTEPERRSEPIAGEIKVTDSVKSTETTTKADNIAIPQRTATGDIAISRDRWLDIIKWAHHTGSVTEEQRRDLIANLMRLSKLVQKGRHLTNRQEQEIRALVARVQSLGYRFV
jgi:DNA-binding response OmpR family regulator